MNPIAKLLLEMARFYGYELEKRQLELYVKVLSQFPFDTVLESGREYMQNPKNERFPIPPHKILAKHLKQDVDPETLAAEIAVRITGAVTKFGWANRKDAQAYIGPEGWALVERQGGWQFLCENLGLNLNPGIYQAQTREALKARLKYGSSSVESAVQQKIEKKELNSLTSAKEILNQITSSKPAEEK